MKKSNKYYFIIIIVVILTLILVYKNTNESFQGTGNQQAYDIIVIAGQSNAEGAGSSGTSRYTDDQNNTEDSDIKQFAHDNSTIKAGKEQLDNLRGEGGGSYGFGMSFARAYKSAGKLTPGRKILLINCAWKSTGFLDYYENTNKIWTIHNDNRSLYYLAKQRILAAKNNINSSSRVVAILWHQGEADAVKVTQPSKKQDYINKLVTMLTTLRTDIQDSTIPILMGGLCPSALDIPGYNTMNNTIQEIVRTNAASHFKFVDSSGLSHDTNAGAKHFSKSSQIEFGKRYFNVYNN